MTESTPSPEGTQMAVETEEPSGTREVKREWLSYREAETLTGLSRTTLWKLVGSSEIEVARVGRAVRINRESLNSFMKSLTENPIFEPK